MVGMKEAKDKGSKLIEAAQEGRLADVKALVEKGVDIDARDKRGGTSLMWAAGSGYVEVVDFLIGAGCDIDARDDSGQNAVMSAAGSGAADCVRRLLAAGSCLAGQDDEGDTVVVYALMSIRDGDGDRGANESLSRLLAGGCEIDSVDRYGNPAMEWASSRGLVGAQEMILAEKERRILARSVADAGAGSGRLRV